MNAWRAASANNVITDVRRRQVVKALEKERVVAFCGQEWAKAELGMNLRQKGLASILTNEIIRREFNKGDSFPILTPSDAAYINEHTDTVGFVGASSIERIAVEGSIPNLTREFKSIPVKRIK